MARLGPPLDTGDAMPPLRVSTLQHGQLLLPDDFAARRGLVLFYRAHW